MCARTADGMRVVVSLTSIAGRAALLARAMDSLARQTRPADALYLWLPREQFAEIPPEYRFPGVEVRRVADLGPATKLLPTLEVETHPETLLITVDDDVEYPPELIERLVGAARILPDCAIGFTGWCVEFGPEGERVRHFNEAVAEAAILQPVQVLEGYRGVLYRRDFFGADLPAHLAALAAFRMHDDMLFSGYLASRGIARVVRWFGDGFPPPGDRWGLLGDHLGLHTSADWLERGRACFAYWVQRAADFAQPCAPLAASGRLQCGGGRRHAGFVQAPPHAEAPGEPARELLALSGLPQGERLLEWLDAWTPHLAPGAVLRLSLAGEPAPHGEAARVRHGDWRGQWEADDRGRALGLLVHGTPPWRGRS